MLIKLRIETGIMSKRQQPDQELENSTSSQIGPTQQRESCTQ